MTSPVSSSSPQPRSREELKRLYQQSIGGTFFRQMMKALRSTTGQAAYFNGGQAEKIFQGQFDELMIEKLAETSGGMFSDAMFEQQFPDHSAPKPTAPRPISQSTDPPREPSPPSSDLSEEQDHPPGIDVRA